MGVFRNRQALYRTVIACCLSTLSQSAWADVSAQDRRSILIGHIRATSDCMASEALKLPGLVHAAKDNDWPAFLNEVAGHCRDRINAMIRVHDQFYGAGSGRVFYNNGYLRDLPRAIRSRIGSQIDRKIAEAKARTAAEKTHATGPEKPRSIAPGKPRLAAPEKTGSIASEKAKPALPQVTVKRAEPKPADPNQYRKALALSFARLEMSNLRSKLYVCTDRNIAKAGALQGKIQALTETVIDSCEADFEAALQSVINLFKIDAGLDTVTEEQEAMLREEILRVVRAHIVSAATESRKPR